MTDLTCIMEVEWKDVGVEPDPTAVEYDNPLIISPDAAVVCQRLQMDSLIQLHLFLQGMCLVCELLKCDPNGEPISVEEGNEQGAMFEQDILRSGLEVRRRWISRFSYLIPVEGRQTGVSRDWLLQPERLPKDWEWAREAIGDYVEDLLRTGEEMPPVCDDAQVGMDEAVFQLLRGVHFMCEQVMEEPGIADDYSATQVLRDVRRLVFKRYFEHILDGGRQLALSLMPT